MTKSTKRRSAIRIAKRNGRMVLLINGRIYREANGYETYLWRRLRVAQRKLENVKI